PLGGERVSVADVRATLERFGLAAHRARGQNFLVDPHLAAKLVARAGVGPGETVLEIGTGLGILTRALAARAARVVSVEIDAGLVRAVHAEGGLPAHVELHHADALELDLAALLPGGGPARVVASLPYAVASPLLRRLLDLRARVEGFGVLLQAEVANRLKAGPGSRDYGSLAVLHQLTVKVGRGLPVSPRCFHPVPRVLSTFLTLTPLREPLLAPGELPEVENLVRAAFRHRRKTVANSLRAALPRLQGEVLERVLHEQGIDPRARAESLAPRELLGLARSLRDAGSAPDALRAPP
ncbi:MAG TPA: 16S rRNA (adenine(1518)-N(6)/adenine(1519)-N(6))-dimethyltransferase RsmA, partial [Vicinamibacteria bacterium]|nr:16S rRNA (adenine(1518)-N(6)/adenine(1519)-N(6))-dimethyltransferase RsmA [Vicinamibacteria bacterium]